MKSSILIQKIKRKGGARYLAFSIDNEYADNVVFTGIVAVSGQVLSGDIYAWMAVFVLPVNSALNPFLYTLTAILKKEVRTCLETKQIYTYTSSLVPLRKSSPE